MNRLRTLGVLLLAAYAAVPCRPRRSPAELLPGSGEVDSCVAAGDIETYDTTTLYEKINGYADFFLTRGFIRCAYREYRSPRAVLAGKRVKVTLNEMANGDSARSVFAASMEHRDTAAVVRGVRDTAVVTRGSWNEGCFMRKGRWFIEFGAIPYDTTTGMREAVRATFGSFCRWFDGELP